MDNEIAYKQCELDREREKTEILDEAEEEELVCEGCRWLVSQCKCVIKLTQEDRAFSRKVNNFIDRLI